jgi:hypothetical protein
MYQLNSTGVKDPKVKELMDLSLSLSRIFGLAPLEQNRGRFIFPLLGLPEVSLESLYLQHTLLLQQFELFKQSADLSRIRKIFAENAYLEELQFSQDYPPEILA